MMVQRSRHRWLVAAMTAVLCLALALPVVAQAEEEGDEEAARLAKELTAKLDALAKAADKVAKAEEGGKTDYGVEEVSTILDWLGSHTRKIEKHSGAKGDTGNVRKAKELSGAVRDAQAEVQKFSKGESTVKLIVIVCQKVDRVGRELAAGLISPNN